MLKSICAIMLSAILVLPLLSCQPTPEKDIVVNKNDGKLEEKLYATPSPFAQSGEPSAPPTTYEVPERVTDSFEAYKGQMDVQIDAAVTMPKVETIPVYSTKEKVLDQQQVDKILDALIGDAPMYYVDDTQTKADIESDIMQLKKELADFKNGIINPVYDTPPTEEYYNNMIAEYEAAYAAAPEKLEDRPISREEYNSAGRPSVRFVRSDGKTGRISLSDGFIAWNLGDEYADRSVYYEDKEELLPFTRVQAITQAEKFAHELGIDDIRVAATTPVVKLADEVTMSQTDSDAYCVIFTRDIDSIPYHFMGMDERLPMDNSKDGYMDIISYELLKIVVDKTGPIGIDWVLPRDITETVNPNVELLPFDTIMERFHQQALSTYSQIGSTETSGHFTLLIQDIRLAYLPFAKKNDLDTQMLIPVWCFYGGSIYEDNRTDEEIIQEFTSTGRYSRNEAEAVLQESNDYDRKHDAAQRDPNVQKYRPLLAINAIDGSNVPC